MYNDFKKDNKITLEGISGKSVAPFTNIEFDEKKEILSMKAESQGEYTISGNINEYVDYLKNGNIEKISMPIFFKNEESQSE